MNTTDARETINAFARGHRHSFVIPVEWVSYCNKPNVVSELVTVLMCSCGAEKKR